MLAVILKILSILGILLLILLGIALFLVLLVLFMPIVYKADAAKSDTELTANVKIRWLFGLLRVCYNYPEPGNVVVKLLWKTVYDSGKSSGKREKTAGAEKEEAKTETKPESASEMTVSDTQDSHATVAEKITDEKEEKETEKGKAESATEKDAAEHGAEASTDEAESSKTLSEKLFAKYEKIKYTIRQFYDKIKHIWENITFYKKLLQDEQTKLLFSHALNRIGKILRHIRPRKLKADVIFGTGSPDTTGYAYGVYGMFSPRLGKNVVITPDFEQQILTGTVYAAGHLTIFTLLVNGLAVLLDKRLQILIKRLKNHSAKLEKEKAKAEEAVKASA